MVRADEVKQFCARKTPGIVARGVNGVGNAAALEFLSVDFVMSFAGERQPKQAQPFRRRRGCRVRLERRLRGGDKEKPVEPGFLAGRLRHEQVTQMDRIERTAEQTDFLFRFQTFNNIATAARLSNTDLCH